MSRRRLAAAMFFSAVIVVVLALIVYTEQNQRDADGVGVGGDAQRARRHALQCR